jgi:hypothetical protein
VGIAAGLTGLVLLTWLRLVGGLWVGLTGRAWLIHGVSIAAAVGWMPVVVLGIWLSPRPAVMAALVAALPYLAVGAVVLKLTLAGYLVRSLRRHRIVPPSVIGLAAAAWAVAAVGAVAWLRRLVPPEQVPLYALALGVVLALPLNRFAAMPRAVEWNRHR